jgi:hypothetical protein
MKNPYVEAGVKHGDIIPRPAIDEGLRRSFVVIGNYNRIIESIIILTTIIVITTSYVVGDYG